MPGGGRRNFSGESSVKVLKLYEEAKEARGREAKNIEAKKLRR